MQDNQEIKPEDINTVPICSDCGSEHVIIDAFACFNRHSGLWELEEVRHKQYCRACKRQISFDWIPAETLQNRRVRALNDRFRIEGKGNGRVVVTVGIQEQSEAFLHAAINAVRGFDDFSEDNDPWGEHDFGAIDIEDQKVFWKIDCYDPTLTQGSENPANDALTHRVLTIMLASEY